MYRMHRRSHALLAVIGLGAWFAGCGSLPSRKARDAAAEVRDDVAGSGVSEGLDAPNASGETADGGMPESSAGGSLPGETGGPLDSPAGAEVSAAETDAAAWDGPPEDLPTVEPPPRTPNQTTVVRALPEPWGANCPRGGVKIETGFDNDGNGTLDYYEVIQEQYVCNVYPVGVSLGPRHSCALASSGAVWCWGADDLGQLGDSAMRATYAPRPVAGAPAALAVASGGDFACIILPTRGARCWGKNDHGQGGHGIDAPYITPSCVVGPLDAVSLLDVTAIAAGGAHACAAIADGKVDCWGANDVGQLGDGTGVDSNRPVEVLGITDAESVVAGGRHACALLADKTVRCWGANAEGQLGNGTTAESSAVVRVGDAAAPLAGVSALAAGDAFTCALMQDATVKCWGANAGCQLGQPSTTGRALLPTLAPATDVKSIAAGAEHACAILNSGKAVCWGKNDFGQVGARAGACREEPVELPLTGVLSIAGGGTHSCAVDETGLWCWGDDSLGQLGIGVAGADRSTHLPQLAVWHLAP